MKDLGGLGLHNKVLSQIKEGVSPFNLLLVRALGGLSSDFSKVTEIGLLEMSLLSTTLALASIT